MKHGDELKTLMADYLDELLEADEARAAEQAIAEHPQVFAEVARVRALLFRPYAVAPPTEDQPRRILAKFHDRPWRRIMRYAAVFVAGVLSTLLARSPTDRAPISGEKAGAPSARPPRVMKMDQPTQPAVRFVVNRRLR